MPASNKFQRYLDAVISNVVDGVVIVDTHGMVLNFNPAAERIFGYDASEIVGCNISMLIPESDRPKYAGYLGHYLRTGEPGLVGTTREVVALRKDGTEFPMELAISEIQRSGRPMFIGTLRDITRRKESEEALRRSEERFELAVAGSRDGLWDWNIVSDTVYYAPQFRALLGYGPDEFPGVANSFRDSLHPDDRARVFAAFMDHLRNRVPFDEEFRHRAKDGSIRYFRARGQAVWNEEGIATRMAGSVTDITDRKEEQRQLERQALEARMVHQATAMAAATESFEEALQHCVDIVCEMTGWPVGHAYLPADDGRRLDPSRIWCRDMSETYRELREVTELTSFTRGDGLPGRIWESGEPVWIVNVLEDDRAGRKGFLGVKGAFGFPVTIRGETVAVLEFFQDDEIDPDESLLLAVRTVGEQVGRVLERKRAELELRKARDAAEAANESKSRFLANMSHELRTPLNSVIGFSNVLLKNDGKRLSGEELAYLQRIRDNGIHLLSLINEVLDISKIEAGRLELEIGPVGPGRIIREALASIEGSALGKNLQLVAEIPDSAGPIDADETRLRQVLINLLGNAVKFTDDGSIVVRLIVDETTGRPRRIEVEDSGIGIEPETLESIFDAFQQADSSTTRKYGGTGLGLAISRSLCRLMHFDLVVESEPGRGSVFTVELEPEAVEEDSRTTAESLTKK